jgi:hypothetical protein
LIIVTFLILGSQYSTDYAKYALKNSLKTIPPSPHCTSVNRTEADWEFQVQRDGDNHALSDEQCLIAFPKLFVEIEKTAALRKERSITFKEVDDVVVEDGMVRAAIWRGEVSCSSLLHVYSSVNAFLLTAYGLVIYHRLCGTAVYILPSKGNTELPASRFAVVSGSTKPAQYRACIHGG